MGRGERPRASSKQARGAAREQQEADTDLAPVVGENLRRLRARRGLSLESLAHQCGVSRAMLGQIELGQSAPTINLLWKVAHGLGVPFSALLAVPTQPGPLVLRAKDAKILTNRDRVFSSRALFPVGEPRQVEFYELRLAPSGLEKADAHAPGTVENLVVTAGAVELEAGGKRYQLDPGDAIQFAADSPHRYRNRGRKEAVMYLVMTYAVTTG